MTAAPTAGVLPEEMRFVAPDTDLAILREREEARGREVAAQHGVLASLTGLDAGAWRLTRFTLRAEPAAERSSAEIAHLAASGLAAARRV